MKKISYISIIFFLIMLTSSFSYCLNNRQINELHQLKILKGDGENYLLNDRLTKAQGLTFILRLLGKEKLVKENKDILLNIGFSDLDKNKWYTPYFVYGRVFGLIKINQKQDFKPSSYLSERDYYKMILNALNVNYNKNNIEKIAYQKRIILKKDDKNEKNYLRRSALDVIYKTLKNNKYLIDNLIKNRVVNINDIEDLIVYKTDNKITQIKNIFPISQNKTIIHFNEEISDIQLSIDNLEIENITISGSLVKINHKEKDNGKKYLIRVNSVFDSEGFENRYLNTIMKFKK